MDAEDEIALARLRENLAADLYSLDRDLVKYREMLKQHGVLHPATTANLPASAERVIHSVEVLWEAREAMRDR